MKEHKPKTNAVRLLDTAGVKYELRYYKVDESDLSAPHVAELIGMPALQVFKTLVARGDRTGVLMACVPGALELDLKSLAQASGNKKVDLVAVKEITDLTGYIRGGVSPLGGRKKYPFFLDSSAQDWPCIAISAGVRGCQVVLAPSELVRLTGAISASLSKPAAE